MNLNASFWSGKRVLITGHTGFKGSWLSLWLSRLGARVTGVSLPPATTPNLYALAQISDLVDSKYVDINDKNQLVAVIEETLPEIAFHLAAQPLVRVGYRQPLETFATNIMGTAHLLEALRQSDSARVVVVVTSDKVYKNREWPYPYREDDMLGGIDPYSASKAAGELIAACYRDAFLAKAGTAVATVRAGNVIGGGDWSEDRLIPDAVRAWTAGLPLEVRRPSAIRPWQHVLEPLAGYCVLAEKLWDSPALAGAYNFGPEPGTAATVRQVIELARTVYESGELSWATGEEGPHEAKRLALEIAKSRSTLGVAPEWRLVEAVKRTMDWYKRQNLGADARQLCLADIDDYASLS